LGNGRVAILWDGRVRILGGREGDDLGGWEGDDGWRLLSIISFTVEPGEALLAHHVTV